MIKSELKKIIRAALAQCYPEIQVQDFTIEEPATGIEADLCSNVAFIAAKAVKLPPFKVAWAS